MTASPAPVLAPASAADPLPPTPPPTPLLLGQLMRRLRGRELRTALERSKPRAGQLASDCIQEIGMRSDPPGNVRVCVLLLIVIMVIIVAASPPPQAVQPYFYSAVSMGYGCGSSCCCGFRRFRVVQTRVVLGYRSRILYALSVFEFGCLILTFERQLGHATATTTTESRQQQQHNQSRVAISCCDQGWHTTCYR